MILNRQRAVRVAQQPLQEFLCRVQRELGVEKGEVTVCLVSDAEIARMNQAFRKKIGPTDVLSFPAAAQRRRMGFSKDVKTHGDSEFLGDIAIAPGTARRNARRGGRAFADEMRVLILHGLLHLLGYDHEADHGEMDRIEQRLRKRLGLA